MIARRLDEPARARLPADRLELVVTSDASTDRTEEIAAAFAGVRVDPQPARRQGRRAGQRRARRPRARSSRSPTRTRPGRRTRSASSSPTSPTRRSPTCAAGSCSRRRTAPTRRALYWRYESGAARAPSRGSVPSPAATARSTRFAARTTSRSTRAWGHDLSFPYLMVQRGPPRRLRAGRARVREADADERDGVPAQGAHVRALLADHAARLDAEAPAARLPRRSRLAPRAPLRERHPASRPARELVRARRRRPRLPGRARRTARCCWRRAALGVGLARYYVLVTWATVVSLWNYLRRGVPATWEAAEGTR